MMETKSKLCKLLRPSIFFFGTSPYPWQQNGIQKQSGEILGMKTDENDKTGQQNVISCKKFVRNCKNFQ